MKRTFILIFVLILTISGVAVSGDNPASQAYNPAVGKASMQSIMMAMQKIMPALESSDFAAVEDEFMVVKESFENMLAMEAPTGDNSQWESAHSMAIKLSDDGIEAARMEDSAEIQKIMGTFFSMREQGHEAFQNY
jgi:hypothetical protein